ncbi:putative F-box protein [Cardamine amara subsp. amara]|uniref:F-box protein n=1 Tax=Cardamine amara subsp. amara TaxID=228776 RepID=A0ABD1ANW1_CARAN
MMNRRENLDSIPTDLILEIFSRLPAKSVARFRCLSKLWWSMLSRPYFTNWFLTRSSARPRLLFVVEGDCEWLLSSTSQPENPYGKSSLVVAADFHLKFSEDRKFAKRSDCSYVSGLIHFHKMWIDYNTGALSALSVICNPSTGQYATLPELRTKKDSASFLGFDPIDKQFKVLIMTDTYDTDSVHHILTLGTDTASWRKIQCPLGHVTVGEGICINGVLYYLAENYGGRVIVCFDVRSEKFKFIDTEWFSDDLYGIELINYKGKLGGINLRSYYSYLPDEHDHYANTDSMELLMWVLEDVEKQKLSKYVYTLWEKEFVVRYHIIVVGVTSTGEIVLSQRSITCKPFYVFYFNPERNTLHRVGIHGNHQVWKNQNRVYAIVDHVEDLKFNIMETFISPPEQKHKVTSTSTSRRNKHQVSTTTSTREDHQVKTSTTSTREDHQVKTSTSSGKYHQVRTVAHPQQDYHEWKDHSLKLSSSQSDTPTLEQTMKSFKLGNEKAITEGIAIGSRSKEADKSCKVILGRLSRGSGCLKGTAITAVVLAAAGAVAAVVLSPNPEVTTELMNLVDSYVNAITTALKN